MRDRGNEVAGKLVSTPEKRKNMALPVTRTSISGYLKVSNATKYHEKFFLKLVNMI